MLCVPNIKEAKLLFFFSNAILTTSKVGFSSWILSSCSFQRFKRIKLSSAAQTMGIRIKRLSELIDRRRKRRFCG